MVEIIVVRSQIFDWRRKEWVDEILPTMTVKKAGKYRGTGADLTIGSHFVGQGSVFLMQKLRISSGSADVWWDITTTGTPSVGEKKGTLDVGYFQAKGEEINLMDPKAPLAIQPGTFSVIIRSAGTTNDFGCAFEGIERGGVAE